MKDAPNSLKCTKCGREVHLIYGLVKDMDKYANNPGIELMGCELPSAAVFKSFSKKYKCKFCLDTK